MTDSSASIKCISFVILQSSVKCDKGVHRTQIYRTYVSFLIQVILDEEGGHSVEDPTFGENSTNGFLAKLVNENFIIVFSFSINTTGIPRANADLFSGM